MSGRADYTTNTILVQEAVTNNIGAVSLLGRTAEVSTLWDAVSLAAGASNAVAVNPTTEDELWIAVNIDQQPWTLQSSTRFYSSGDGGADNFFPQRSASALLATSLNTPITSLYLGMRAGTTVGHVSPTTMLEARAFLTPSFPSNLVVRMTNGSASIATITLRVIRIWRKA